MAYKTRINPKTGKTEYKVRYYFMADGKKRDSETGWFLRYNISKEMIPAFQNINYSLGCNASKDIYVITMEDIENGS